MAMKKTKNNSERRRERLRDEHFGDDSWERVWHSADEKRGYGCMPRVLPVLLRLANDKQVTDNKDCRSTYVELIARDWGQALVEIQDEEEHAVRAGYASKRAVRTWRERMRLLQGAGFIEIGAKSFREIGYVLIRHPDDVITALRRAGKVEESLWRLYGETCNEFGVGAPEDPLVPTVQEATIQVAVNDAANST